MKFKQVLVTLLVVTNMTLVSGALIIRAAQSPVGYTDSANCETIGGWAFDPDTSSSPVAVHVYKDSPAGTGSPVAGIETTGTRSDVNAAYGITGTHGFTITTPNSLKDGKTHDLYVYAIDNSGDGNAFLGVTQSPICTTGDVVTAPTAAANITVTSNIPSRWELVKDAVGLGFNAQEKSHTYSISNFGGYGLSAYDQPCYSKSWTPIYQDVQSGETKTFNITYVPDGSCNIIIDAPAPAPIPVTLHPPVGYLESANCSIIGGWAYDQDTSSDPISVHIYKDGPAGTAGAFLLAADTDGSRSDVNAALGITGNHGFTITTPDSLKDGKSHTIYAYGIDSAGGTNALLGSAQAMSACTATPITIDAPAPAPIAAANITVTSNIPSRWELVKDAVGLGFNAQEKSHTYSISNFGGYGLSAYDQPCYSKSWTPIYQDVQSGETKTFNITYVPDGSCAGTVPITIDGPTTQPIPLTLHPPTGYLDAANCSMIAGWAFDSDTPGSQIAVHIYKDALAGSGTPIVAETSGSRSDVNAAYGITGNHGFKITTPDSLKDGKSHAVYVYAIDSAGATNTLIGSQTVNCSKAMNPTAPVETTGLTIGYLDVASCDMIGGWAYENTRPSDPIQIRLTAMDVNGKTADISTKETSDPRPDVNAAYGITGNHGFTSKLPDSYRDGTQVKVTAYGLSKNGAQKNLGSRTFSCSKPIDPTLINEKPRNTIGYLDGASCNAIGGWAYDPDHPNDKLSIKVIAAPGPDNKNPEVTLYESTTGSRPDVNAAFGISGNHGFSITTPSSLKNGGKYTVGVFAYDLDAPAYNAPIALTYNDTISYLSCPTPPIGPHVDPTATIISVHAKGTIGAKEYPRMELRSGGLLLNAWYVTADYVDYSMTIPSALSDNIRVYFTNDYFSSSEDRNLTVDYVTVNGKTYQSKDTTTYVKGTYVSGQGCIGGFGKGETIHCNNGYFEYPTLHAAAVSFLGSLFSSIGGLFR